MTDTASLAPTEPSSLDDTGLSGITLRNIFLKTMFRQSLTTVSSLSRVLCLAVGPTQDLANLMRQQQLVEATGTLQGSSGSEIGLQLTEAGRKAALNALSQSEYHGPLPVPLASFAAQAGRQSIRHLALSRPRLTEAMQHLILPADLIDQLGPAITAGRSILLYGPPGNGKSSIAAAIRDALGDRIYLPQAIEYQGQVISLYDPLVHKLLPTAPEDPLALRRSANRSDRRFLACQRPAVVTGGELTLAMLDLGYSPTTKTYQAPLQLKCTGGVFIVDDLGRQAEPAQALINRWIVPLEDGTDLLTLPSGEKLAVPFDTLVIFSTNFHPHRMFDQAALRRIFFKIRVDGPSQEEFLRLFAQVARKKRLPLDEAALVHLIKTKYPRIDNLYANYHAGFLIDQIISICQFEEIPLHMSPALIDRAWSNLVVEESDVQH